MIAGVQLNRWIAAIQSKATLLEMSRGGAREASYRALGEDWVELGGLLHSLVGGVTGFSTRL